MRIALLQLNPQTAEPEANSCLIEAAYIEAVTLGAELVVATELALVGYVTDDRWLQSDLRQRISTASERLAATCGSVPLIFGTCSLAPSGKLWNELWWCESGKVRSVIRKRTFAMSNTFNEARYFEPDPTEQPVINFKDERIGLAIYEDCCLEARLRPNVAKQALNPIADLAKAEATLILNLVVSPGHVGSYVPHGCYPPWAIPSKLAMRNQLMQQYVHDYDLPVAYVNRVGVEDGVIFDGGSSLVHTDGTWQYGELFATGIILVDTKGAGKSQPPTLREPLWIRKALGLALKEYFSKQKLEAAVVGLSGGIDSAVVAAIAVESLGADKVLGVSLPTSYTSQASISLAKEQANVLGIPFLQINADLAFVGAATALTQVFPKRTFCLTDENLQSRCRGMLLMATTSEIAAQQLVGTNLMVVLNTGNKSEVATGYFTLYGDGIGAVSLLGDCLKARVFSLAKELDTAVLQAIQHRIPTAELRPNQTDETSLIPYVQLDSILSILVETQRTKATLAGDLGYFLQGTDLTCAQTALQRIINLVRNAGFKRRYLPFAIKVSPFTLNKD